MNAQPYGTKLPTAWIKSALFLSVGSMGCYYSKNVTTVLARKIFTCPFLYFKPLLKGQGISFSCYWQPCCTTLPFSENAFPHQPSSLVCVFFHLDFFDIWVPVAHLLHLLHQLIVDTIHGLIHHHLQPKDFPNIWEHFAEDFVPIVLQKGKALGG